MQTYINNLIDIHINGAIELYASNIIKRDDYNILLSDLTMILNRMSDIAIFLDIGLITSVDKIKVNDLENILNELFYNVSMLDCTKETARVRMKHRIIPLFAQLVLSLGFSLTDLREYYFNKFDSNILKLKNEIKNLLEEFDISEIKRATNILLDEMIEKAQYE